MITTIVALPVSVLAFVVRAASSVLREHPTASLGAMAAYALLALAKKPTPLPKASTTHALCSPHSRRYRKVDESNAVGRDRATSAS